MIRTLGDDNTSFYGSSLFEKKYPSAPEWPEKNTRANEPNPIFAQKESSPMFSDTGSLISTSRIGQNLHIKI